MRDRMDIHKDVVELPLDALKKATKGKGESVINDYQGYHGRSDEQRMIL